MTGYAVITERVEDDGFGAWSPDLPGCVSTGRSYEECVNNMREAVSSISTACARMASPFPNPARSVHSPSTRRDAVRVPGISPS